MPGIIYVPPYFCSISADTAGRQYEDLINQPCLALTNHLLEFSMIGIPRCPGDSVNKYPHQFPVMMFFDFFNENCFLCFTSIHVFTHPPSYPPSWFTLCTPFLPSTYPHPSTYPSFYPFFHLYVHHPSVHSTTSLLTMEPKRNSIGRNTTTALVYLLNFPKGTWPCFPLSVKQG